MKRTNLQNFVWCRNLWNRLVGAHEFYYQYRELISYAMLSMFSLFFQSNCCLVGTKFLNIDFGYFIFRLRFTFIFGYLSLFLTDFEWWELYTSSLWKEVNYSDYFLFEQFAFKIFKFKYSRQRNFFVLILIKLV